MLQNLIELVRSNSSLLTHSSITPARQDDASFVAASSINDGLKSVLQSGGVTTVMNFFKGGQTDMLANPVGTEIKDKFVNNFSEKFGMERQEAGSLAGSFLPRVLSQLVSKANDPNDQSFDVQNMFNEMSGGKTSGFDISSIFAKVKAGLDKDNDGDVDLQDLKAMFTGKDGLMDKVKNVFK